MLAYYARTTRANSTLLTLLKVSFALGVAILAAFFNEWFSDGLISFATPFLWLVAVRPREEETGNLTGLSRAILALVAVLQVLYAYPVAGAQVQFSAILIIAVASICLADSLPFILSLLSRWRVPALSRTLGAALGLLLCFMYVLYAWTSFQRYEKLQGLNLFGAHRLRLAPPRTLALTELVSRTNSCTTLVTAPGMFSFYFWTGLPVPLLLDSEAWIINLTDAQQEAVANELSRLRDVCVIYNDHALTIWTLGKDITSKPMMRFIREDFRTTFEAENYKLMVPRR